MHIAEAFPGGVWAVDFEFHAPPGERPDPICMVAKNLSSGEVKKFWQKDLKEYRTAPFPTGDEALMVAYYASAELGCFLALGWPLPQRVLDLYVEFKNRTAGSKVPCGHGLLGALTYFKLDGIAVTEKEALQSLAIRGGPFSDIEAAALLRYCTTDVEAIEKLIHAMLPTIDLPRALVRGRYMAAAAKIERVGVPIDRPMLMRLREGWADVKNELITQVDADFGVFENGVFKAERFAALLTKHQIPWPTTQAGHLEINDETFRQTARAFPVLAPLRELRHSLSSLRLESLAVGRDDRNRCLLSAFKSKTGRNQPSSTHFIFGSSVWLRGLIRPEPGRALAYLDFEQQEFGIAAALSGDKAMQEAYLSEDPYLTFAKQAGAVPATATAQTHTNERALFKSCVLAVQYGMGEKSLAHGIGRAEIVAEELLRKHRVTYSRFWKWSQAAVDYAMLYGKLYTAFGWHLHVDCETNPRTLANFPMQANGAEILRLACCYGTEGGVEICAPIHDAVLIEAPVEQIESVIEQMQQAMVRASEDVLGGFPLRVKAETTIRYPERFMDEKRGRKMWDTVVGILDNRRNEGIFGQRCPAEGQVPIPA